MSTNKSSDNQDNSTEVLLEDNNKGGLKSISHYKLLEVIGEGGMGTVYLAQQDKPIRRKIALKIIKPGMDSKEVIARFESERQALAVMNHPNIAQVYDAGETEQGYPYFIMEYVPGIPIIQYCDKYKLTTPERLKLFMKVCEAIQHAHFKGIVHRDLKPSNVLVSFQEERHIPKVIDFGIAKALTGPGLTEKTLHTRQGIAIGTPVYMSPEQAELTGYDIDARTDIYSLGVLLYELLVGVPPFDSEELQKAGIMEILRKIREEEPPKPSTKFNSLGDISTEIAIKRGTSQLAMTKLLKGDLDWIVMKALEKDRRRRYSSASDFTADIKRYLDKEPIQARPPSIVYKIGKTIQKHKPTTFTIFFILSLILIFSLWNLKERQKAHSEKMKAEASSKEALLHLARNYWEESRQARDDVLHPYSLHLYEVALNLNPNLEFHKTLLLDMNSYWNLLPLVNIYDHKNFLREAKINSDDTRILTLCDRGVAKLWDACTGKQIGPALQSKTKFRREHIFSTDGTKVLFWSTDETIQLWDARTGELIEPPIKHNGEIRGAIFNTDDTKVLTWSEDGTARLWGVDSSKKINPPMKHNGTVYGGIFNADETKILTWSKDGTARLWNVDTCEQAGSPMKHKEAVYGAIFNTDETKILTWSADGTARLWDAKTGKQIASPMVHKGSVSRAEFNSNETRMITRCSNDDVLFRLWDTESGGQIEVDFPKSEMAIAPLFMNENSRFLTLTREGIGQFWDTFTGKQIGLPVKLQRWVRSAKINADETRILTISLDHKVQIWDAKTGNQIGTFLEGKVERWDVNKGKPSGDIFVELNASDGVFSDDGKMIVTFSMEGTTKVWDSYTGDQIGTTLLHQGWVNGARFNDDGKKVLTWGQYGMARLWDNGAQIQSGQPLYLSSAIDKLRFSADETRILTWNNDDNLVRLWEVKTGKQIILPLHLQEKLMGATFTPIEKKVPTWIDTGTQEYPLIPTLPTDVNVKRAIFNDDCSKVVILSADGTVSQWDVITGKQMGSTLQYNYKEFLPGQYYYNGFIPRAKLNTEGSKIFIWSETGKLFDTNTGKQIGSSISTSSDSYVDFNPDGTKILTWHDHDDVLVLVEVWDVYTGKQIIPPPQHSESVMGAISNPDKTKVLTWNDKGTVRICDVNTGRQIGSLKQNQGLIREMQFNTNGTRILTFSSDNTARVWDANTGKQIERSIKYKGTVKDVLFNADKTRIITCYQDKTYMIWDARIGQQIGASIKPQKSFEEIKFNYDGTRILTRSTDNTVRLWNVELGKQLGPTLRHQYEVKLMKFLANETKILTRTKEGTIRLWDIGVDLDFPKDKIKLQIKAITGTRFNPITRQVEIIEAEEWRKIKKEYMDFARGHYRKCKYPHTNVFRRLFPEEAKKVRKFQTGYNENRQINLINELNFFKKRRAELHGYVGDSLKLHERVKYLLNRKVRIIYDLKGFQGKSYKIMKGILKALPRKNLLTGLHLSGRSIKMDGSALSRKSIQDFIINLKKLKLHTDLEEIYDPGDQELINNLQKLKLLSNIELISHKIKDPKGQELFNFSINCEFSSSIPMKDKDTPRKKSKIKKVDRKAANKENTSGKKQPKEVLSKKEEDNPGGYEKNLNLTKNIVKEIEFIKKEIKSLEYKKNKIKMIQSEIEKKKRILELLDDILPEKIDINQVQQEIQTRLSTAKLKTIKISPGIKKKIPFYNAVAFNINVEGDYQQLSFFFDQISKVKRIFRVNQFHIKISGNTLKTVKIEANLTILTFVDHYPTLETLKDIKE